MLNPVGGTIEEAAYPLFCGHDGDNVAVWLSDITVIPADWHAQHTILLGGLSGTPAVIREVLTHHDEIADGQISKRYALPGHNIDESEKHLLWLLQFTLPGQPILHQRDVAGLSEYSTSAQMLRHLIHLKSGLPALQSGSYRILTTHNAKVLAYVRETARQRCYVLANFSPQPETVSFKRLGRWIAGTEQVDGDGEAYQSEELVLQPGEGRLYELRRGDSHVFAI